jgi:nitrous oxide reductase accessory protein NosL
MNRRDLLKFSVAAVGLAALPAHAAETCAGDGTPAQFVPKKAADPKASENDIEKYAKCPYCGMDRKMFHHSRMVVHYSDDLADGTCSIHCASISLSLNVDREPKAIYVADNASAAEIKPLVEVDKATFLIGSQLKGVMTKRSKVAYGSAEAAKASQVANGGELANFDQALLAAHTDMAGDVAMIRKMRTERRKKMMESTMEHSH